MKRLTTGMITFFVTLCLLSGASAAVPIKATYKGEMSNAMQTIDRYVKDTSMRNGHFVQKSKPLSQVFLFVTLSMPTLALRQYMREGMPYHIPMIIRGLVNNNYQKTAARIFKIMHPKNKLPIDSGVAIDPVLFKKFNVEVAPALVVAKGNHYGVIYGNIPIKKALFLITERATNPGVRALAQHLLKSGGQLR